MPTYDVELDDGRLFSIETDTPATESQLQRLIAQQLKTGAVPFQPGPVPHPLVPFGVQPLKELGAPFVRDPRLAGPVPEERRPPPAPDVLAPLRAAGRRAAQEIDTGLDTLGQAGQERWLEIEAREERERRARTLRPATPTPEGQRQIVVNPRPVPPESLEAARQFLQELSPTEQMRRLGERAEAALAQPYPPQPALHLGRVTPTGFEPVSPADEIADLTQRGLTGLARGALSVGESTALIIPWLKARRESIWKEQAVEELRQIEGLPTDWEARIRQDPTGATRDALLQGVVPSYDLLLEAIKPALPLAERTAARLKSTRESLAPVNPPTFFDRFAEGAGSFASFFAAGLTTTGAMQGILRVAPQLARVMGLEVASVWEAAQEGAGTFEELRPVVGEEEAARRANTVLWKNLALVGLTNKLGVFAETGGPLRRLLQGFAMEGVQEAGQYDIERREMWVPATHAQRDALVGQGWQVDEARGRVFVPFDPATAGEALLIGGLLGGPASVIFGQLSSVPAVQEAATPVVLAAQSRVCVAIPRTETPAVLVHAPLVTGETSDANGPAEARGKYRRVAIGQIYHAEPFFSPSRMLCLEARNPDGEDPSGIDLATP